ncbi:DNA-binding HORMA [Cordyceps fumosorosea ARSEF 2679]|uniref:ATP phosphoribosyltransferase n=1 Tax=Cordyceps fumosorosea (strain ARSEF 2679) TaxID=1081104 RepID=A0A167S710_CORFA|nr:DNA-binding HORMA [Cordyceps fumosorosea ARSEF 2679]OAA59323.1 DNA-binding HORMA [Cordyceps fumosorosea ARSEF 2679]
MASSVAPRFSFVFHAPAAAVEACKAAIFKAGAGRYPGPGSYTECCWSAHGTGQFRPGATANPNIGSVGALEHVDEVRVETLCVGEDVARRAVAALKDLVDQAGRLLASFSSFLAVAVHSLLFHRGLYPARSFLAARAYNLPVHQSRHPGVCAWVADAVAAGTAQVRAGTARAVVLAVHAPRSMAVLERWVFDLRSFPADWGDAGTMTARGDDSAAGLAEEQQAGATAGAEDEVNWTDVNEGLRGALRRIAYAAEKSPALPENCTFTLAVELRDDSDAPIGHPQSWIPAEAAVSSVSARRDVTTTPVRSVNAGPLFFECWLEKTAQAQESQEIRE